jgi:cell division protein FtsB
MPADVMAVQRSALEVIVISLQWHFELQIMLQKRLYSATDTNLFDSHISAYEGNNVSIDEPINSERAEGS